MEADVVKKRPGPSRIIVMVAVLAVVSLLTAGCVPLELTPATPGKQPRPDRTSGPSAASKPTINIDRLEQRIHELINQERAKHGLMPLAWNSKLNRIARLHSQDMVRRNYFSHYSPEGNDFSHRYSQQGYVCEVAVGKEYYTGAENIFENHLYESIEYINNVPSSYRWRSLEQIAQVTVAKWMNSPGHRANILEPNWKTEGIGVAVSNDYKVLITENFC
jgi:uncharacterized protein YkwD